MDWTDQQKEELARQCARIGYKSSEPWGVPLTEMPPELVLTVLRTVPDGNAQATAAYDQLVDSLKQESDRAAAIMGASFLDAMLADFLQEYLIHDGRVAELFRGDRPLATFSARISLLFALGFLPPDLYEEFTRVRRIRNHFAHHPLSATFDDQPIRDWCSALITVYPTRREQLAQIAAWSPRQRFEMTLLGLSGYLEMQRCRIRVGDLRACEAPPSFDTARVESLLEDVDQERQGDEGT
jgi:DNA-binding MltR family transcriptional regulator